jgi:hypothetical protein
MSMQLSGLLRAGFALSVGTLVCSQASNAAGHVSAFTDLESYVQFVQKLHKAPFDRDGSVLPPGGAQALAKKQAEMRQARAAAQIGTNYRNIQVTQDRNPWPKAEVAAAIDPTSAGNWVVMTNDFRENWDKMFFHVSTDDGRTWTDDAMVGGSDPFTGFLPSTFQSDPGLSFDSSTNSYLSTLTGNLIVDFNAGYENFDTEVDIAQGFAGGTYANLLPTPIDIQPCNGLFSAFSCDATLDKPFVTTDSNPGSSRNGTTYAYYTLFCNSPASGFCVDGSAKIPSGASAIVESHSPAPGQPFSAPALVSGSKLNTQFSSMVIDSSGVPHVFFDDFTHSPTIDMWEATLSNGKWVVSSKPIVSFVYKGLGNPNWGFRDGGSVAPGCTIHGLSAYCAFSANQIGSGKVEVTPSVYVVAVHAPTSAVTYVTRVNNDPFNDQKHHFFPWAAATPSGSVYVGWYDDRNDRFNTKVDYFVAKSVDLGKTFPKQQAVTDVNFNPCVGFPSCGFFGDYTQLVSGPDGVIHAAWSDTRDGASMQIWSQTITW